MAFYPGESFEYKIQNQEEPAEGSRPGKRTGTEESPWLMVHAVWDKDGMAVTVTELAGACRRFRKTAVLGEGDKSRGGTKNVLKRLLYGSLKEQTGRELPWGTLTGIRPAKIVMARLEEGRSDREIRSYMKETYLAGDDKIGLSLNIAKRERSLLSSIDCENGYSLYVGIPFCPTTCLYCSFPSFSIKSWEARIEEYLTALFSELDYAAKAMAGKKPDTVYVGGGTPTSLQADPLERMLKKLVSVFDLSEVREFTVEAGRPDSITEEKLEVLLRHGVTRISINPQTMKQATLDLIGRRHTVSEVRETFHLARRMGFDNINMDLIMGLPGEGRNDVIQTLEEIKALAPDGITVHSLAVKRAAALNMDKERYGSYKFVNTQEMIDLTADCARSLGQEPYYLYRQKNMAGNFENVGYSKPGKACLYNILIMEEKETIIGCGAGTTTKVVFPKEKRLERTENVKNVEQYMLRIGEMISRKEELFRKL